MKKVFAALLLTASFAIASAQSISFDKTTYDYGNIKMGADGHRMFTVKNTGDKPLIISKVQASCGCTTPEWSQDPIMPGKTAQIKVGYNTTIVGPFAKNIEVYSNDPKVGRETIMIKGNVEGSAVAAPAAAMMSAEAVPAQAARTK
ncbi:DUF1573 domain-containing protein [Chryseobacterium sp. MP_3.2]|uniref:DUF1573 domain-containing protein n=1 Tax=Chryseobacterium sp. MP_3.2 TaxID=3071712 RepID=UPI002E0C8CE9|nr:hypothetical protein [Chryseobacterium sp. MP_3.2]